jgi:di/tricarboxylate transporter
VGWEAWFVSLTLVAVLVTLIRATAPTDLVLVAAMALLLLVGAITGSDRLVTIPDVSKSFGNTAPITVGFLFVVVAGLEMTGAMEWAMSRLLGRPQSVRGCLARLLPLTAGISAFMNNTPVVAAMIPVSSDLAKRARVSASSLYLPMNYATVLGGLCTLIGTSTNLIVADDLAEARGSSVGFFEVGLIGLPIALGGIGFLLLASPWLLKDRRAALSFEDDPRRYTVEMTVAAGGPLVGKTVEEAGLRHLPGLFLSEIERGGDVIAAVGPEQRLMAGDALVFSGALESVVDLQRIRGLQAAADESRKLPTPKHSRTLVEAVISSRCQLIGQSIREGRFRTVYGAAVIAMARGGQRIAGKLGDVVLEPGDVLLLEAPAGFVKERRRSPDFLLMRSIENSAPVRHDRAGVALVILLAMVAMAGFGLVDILIGAMVASVAMIGLRCCTLREARRSIDWSTIISICAALALGSALSNSGAAEGLAEGLLALARGNHWGSLLAVYLATMLLTELVTNNAAAALMMPLGLQAARQLGVEDPSAFGFAVMIAASCGFATPFGYQTNLMVYGPGGYQFNDYLRLGIPLNLIAMIVALLLIPLIWSIY